MAEAKYTVAEKNGLTEYNTSRRTMPFEAYGRTLMENWQTANWNTDLVGTVGNPS
jgi:hypothetical protein